MIAPGRGRKPEIAEERSCSADQLVLLLQQADPLLRVAQLG